MASLYKEALKNAQKQQDEFRKYVEKSAAKQSKKKTEPQPIPRNQSTSEIPARSKDKHKSSSGRHRIDADTRETLNKEVQTNSIPQAITRFNEKVVNDIALAPVTIPYQIATGKKLIDFGLDPETESAKVGAGVGNFLGTAASYALGYKAAGKAISKGAEKLLASEAGKKAASKIVGSALGRKAGQEAAENVVGGIARNIVGDATVGTLLNLSDARGRGLEGEELAKDMALNAAIDFGVGNALEFLPMAAKAIKNVKTEPRIVNGKVKYVKVNNTANQTAGENLPFADSVARDIPFADSANVTAADIMTPETQQKIFSAVGKRSGAKIVRADLPDGVDGKYENGVITISNTAKNPAYTVLKHELTHHIESSGNYQALSDFIERNMKEAGYDVEGAINQIALDYKRAGKELSPEQAKKEFVAKFSEEYLFNSEKSIERLARENPNVFRQIYDWIVDTIRKIGASDETKFLIDAQRKYEKALRTVGKNTTGETQYLFAGRRSLTANETLRQTAEDMLKAGKTPQEVWEKTGWKFDIDGMWKYEIDDSKMLYDGNGKYHSNPDIRRFRELEEKIYFKNSGTEEEMAELQALSQNLKGVSMEPKKLGDMIVHTELFEAYPQLRNVDVQFANLPENVGAAYNPEINRIVINRNSKVLPEKVKKDIIHEIQHAIQNEEGFASGASLELWESQRNQILTDLTDKLKASEKDFDDSIDRLIDYLDETGFTKINDVDFDMISESGKQEIYNHLKKTAPHLLDYAKETLETKHLKTRDLMQQIANMRNRTTQDLYLNTAGEIEARKAASRINLNSEQRRSDLPFVGDENTVFIDKTSGAQMSFIGKNQDGIEAYKTSDKIKNMPLPEKKKFFKNKLENEYNGRTIKFQKNGKTYYASFDGVDVDKIIYGDNKSDGSGYKAKINAGADGDFFDLIERSNYDKTLPEKGKISPAHKDVKTWDYYTKTVEIDGNPYDEVINVRDKGNGQYVYSVTLKKHKKIEPSSKALAYNGKKPNGYAESGGLTLTEILPRNDPGVNAKKTIPLESRVTGDALLDAQDTIEVVKSVGGNTDDNGYVTLYHRTSKENADKIKKSGKMSAKEDGVFFSTLKSGYNDGYGDSVVELKIPAEKLVLDDIFDNEAHFRIPLKNKDAVLDVSGYLVDDAYSAGKTLESTDYTRRLKQTSQNLYGETGNKYLDIPKADETMPKQPAAEPKAEPEPVKAPRGSVKARGYERRKVNHLKQNIKASLGVNKYSDNAKMNSLIDDAVEKMKNGRLSDSEKNALFDTLFEEGIITDTTMLDRYADLKRDLRNTAIKVTDDIKANIPDFQNFRQGTFGKLRLNDAEGMAVDDLYAGLRMQYPELFPELNTTAEMVQRLAEVAGSIKQTETRLTHAFSTDIETLRAETKAGFDAAMDEMEKQVNIVSKYLSRPTVISSDEAAAYARNIKQIKRDIEYLNSKILLDDEDRGIVEMLLKGRISPKTVRQININAENIITMYEAKAKLQAAEKGLADIKAKTRAEYTTQAEGAIEGSELWKDRAGFRMSRETPERVMYDIAGKESGQKLIDSFIRPIHQNEAISTKMKKELRGTAKELNISTKPQYEVSPDLIEAPGLKEEHLKEIRKTRKINLSESALVQLYGEGLIDTDVLEIVGADVPKIQNAVTTMRQIYNQLIDAANQELIRHGYEPIEYRKDYFPHFTEERPDGVLANIADKLGIKILKDELPTDIAGLTHTFRPGKKWFGNALSRTGRYTEYDAIKGFDIYLEGIADVIHHTEDIQKLRTLENTLRLRYSDDGVRSEILKLDEQVARGEITDAVRDARAALIFDAGDTKLGSFATWLRNYTDSLAGKKTLLDRTFEHAIGRTLYNSSKAIENRVAANMVSLNPASWLTNLIPIAQAGEVKQINLIKGMAQTINNKVRPDSFADASVFLTNRKGSDVLWKSSTEKWQDILTSPMKWIDEFTSETITRAKYLEEIDKGTSPAEAMRRADDLAASIIADRSKGALPNAFNHKNPVAKLFTMYQVEVNNQWSHLLKDIPRTEGNVKRVAMAFTKYAIASYLFNDIYEYFIGRRPALDPISWVNDFVGDITGKKVPNFMDALFKGEGFDTEQKTGGAAVAGLGKNIAQDIPFAGGLLEGGRVPISSALPSASKLATTGGNLITGDVPTSKALYDIGNELAKPLTYMALPYGGGQLKKIAEGTETFIRKGNYTVNNNGEDELRYAVDPTAGNLTKGLLFGRYSMGNADEYIDSGFKRLSKNKTKAYKDAIEAGASPQETENFLRSLKGKSAAEIRKAIMDSDFTPAQKNAIGLPLEKDKTIDYSSQTSYQTSLLTPKQQEKVSDLKITGLSDEDALEAYNMYLDADGSDVAKGIEMLTKRSYQDMVFEVLGISNGNVNEARELTSVGITGKQYDTVKKLADANGSGQVSIEEAKAYLDSKSFTRKEKFALVKALTGCKDKNNPYR